MTPLKKTTPCALQDIRSCLKKTPSDCLRPDKVGVTTSPVPPQQHTSSWDWWSYLEPAFFPLEIMSHLILMEYMNVSVFWKKLISIPTNALAWLLQVLRGASYTTPEETNTSRKDIKTTSPPSLPPQVIMISNEDSSSNESTKHIIKAISYNKIPEDKHTSQTIKNKFCLGSLS